MQLFVQNILEVRAYRIVSTGDQVEEQESLIALNTLDKYWIGNY